MLTPEQIEANKAGIRSVFGRFMPSATGRPTRVMLDNAEWL